MDVPILLRCIVLRPDRLPVHLHADALQDGDAHEAVLTSAVGVDPLIVGEVGRVRPTDDDSEGGRHRRTGLEEEVGEVRRRCGRARGEIGETEAIVQAAIGTGATVHRGDVVLRL